MLSILVQSLSLNNLAIMYQKKIIYQIVKDKISWLC